ncbi:cupin domain-containing protein [Paraburkholderia acidipaludis]|uniref:cupin domain-containing protein n=1 Tax=Paraburkholderia acidipaludis TaxID=660537 RepID=UPI0004880BDB|nr:cupin domain-containing protein [Paraburkholderia acidipaludis]
MNVARGGAFGNVFAGIDRAASAERVDKLVAQSGVVIERIVSTGQVSPAEFWYDDPRDEWVVLLTGAAALQFESEGGARRPMLPGDYVHIPAHCRHRVAWTDKSAQTIWVAVYFGAEGEAT